MLKEIYSLVVNLRKNNPIKKILNDIAMCKSYNEII